MSDTGGQRSLTLGYASAQSGNAPSVLCLCSINACASKFFEANQAGLCPSIVKANSHGMFSIYVFCAYVENISSELRYALPFLSTCGKHTK